MKIIHITDMHISSKPIFGLDPIANFELCISHVQKNHSDCDAVVLTGDLVNDGRVESYLYLRNMLDRLGVPYFPLIGNHDCRESFLKAFPSLPVSKPHVQYQATIGGINWIFLDTVEDGESKGFICETRLRWLDECLSSSQADQVPTFILMHHNPTTIHVASSDSVGLVNCGEFQEVLLKYRNFIRGIFFGHCHQTISGSIFGIPMSCAKGTNHQIEPDFSGDTLFKITDSEPSYNVIFIDRHAVIIHSVEFKKGRLAAV